MHSGSSTGFMVLKVWGMTIAAAQEIVSMPGNISKPWLPFYQHLRELFVKFLTCTILMRMVTSVS